MTLPHIGALNSYPALERLDLLAPTVAEAAIRWGFAEKVSVVEIDPQLADTATMMDAFSLPLTTGANCVIIGGKRDGAERIAACIVRADTRVDVNNVVKKVLDVRRPSFLPLERAISETGMEYGGITPLGLPSTWRLLIDGRVPSMDLAIIGSGLRRSKLLLPGRLVTTIPGAEIVEGLGR